MRSSHKTGIHISTLLIAASFCLLAASPLFAGPGPRVLGSGSLEDPPAIQVLRSGADGVELEFSLPALAVEDVEAAGQTFQSVLIPGGGAQGAVGSPMIPTFSRFVAVPERAGIRVEATIEESEEVSGYKLLPIQAEEGSAFAYDPSAYERNSFGSIPLADPDRPALVRNLRVVALTFAPVQFNPAEGKLRIARRMRVQVSFTGVDTENSPVLHSRPLAPSFDRLYRELVLNYGAPTGGRETQPGTWLIICPNNSSVTTRLQPLLDWRQRSGHPVRLATTQETGTSKESIKSFIQNAYDTWPNPPEFVVLAGDATGSYAIPTWTETVTGYYGEGDHPYTQLAGNDVLSDVHLGRLSFETLGELETIVAKIVGYESTPWIQDDPTWFGRACLVGDPSPSGLSCIQVMQWIKTRLRELGYAQVDTVFSGNYVSQMTTALNRGDTIFAYRGYYQMSGWGNSQTYALTNGWKMSFGVMSTCGTGSFDGSTARSEAFLRAGSPTQPKGSVAAIGTATTGTHTRYNNCYTYGVFYGLLYENHYQFGVAHTRGKLELYLNYNMNSPTYVYAFSHWNNLMGDPATECWTGFPDPLSVIHPTVIPVGSNAVAVSVTEGGNPAAGAQVSLWKGTETYVIGLTNEAGICEVPITAATDGNMLLTVTKHDRYPFMATIPVTTQSFVGYQASTVDDDGSGLSQGNADGQVNPGETIELSVQLRNFGLANAPEVTAHLTCDDPYVVITQADGSFGDIAGGGSGWGAGAFVFSVDPGCPHGRTLRFGLEVSSGTDQWRSLIDLDAVSADLSLKEIHIIGGGGTVDPGETVQLSIGAYNFGGLSADTPQATLLSLSQFVNILVPNATYPTIPPQGSGENTSSPFTIQAAPETYPGYQAHLKIAFEFSGGIRDTLIVTVPIGQRTNDDPTGPDGYGYYAFDNTDVAYPDDAPTYNWIEIDPVYGGTGTEIPIADYGNDQDKSRTVGMPFDFQYYGETYNTATVCSNGWIVMGGTYLADYRNWTIPSAGGPNGVIAPYWDDLYVQGNGKVYQWFDAANHRWIVEWSHLLNLIGSYQEVFQAIFYDPAYYPTDTGDGLIEFQYNQVQSSDGTDGYFTTGIEKPDNTDGVLYAYFNQYTPGSASISSGRAIRFVPKVEHLVGQLHGTVRNDAGGAPIGGATVTVLELGDQFITGMDGTYQGAEPPGTYTVAASRAGFQADTVSNVVLTMGGLTQLDFLLHDVAPPHVIYPASVPSTSDSLGPYPVVTTVSDASPLAEASLYFRQYDMPFTRLALTPYGSFNTLRALIPGQQWTTRVDYYIYVRDGAGNVTTMPPGAPDQVYTFWVAPLLTAFADDMEADSTGWTGGVPGDDATSGIWVQVDPNGTFHDTDPVQPEDDHTSEPGVLCWATGNADPGSDEDAADVDGGTTTLLSPPLDLNIDGVVLLQYWRWYTNDTGGNPGSDAWVVQASSDNGASWVDLERTSESARSWVQMEFNLGDHIALTDSVRLRFVASDLDDPSIVEAAVDDIQILYFGLSPAAVGETGAPRFGLAEGLANPIRPGGAIRFALDRPSSASLVVYDVAGRAVRRLVGGPMSAGAHTVVWDGRDEAGRALSSGVYFYRLQAGRQEETRKALLLR